jgi:hypothetical protein
MSLREAIYARCTAHAGIAAIIGDACYPDALPDPDEVPAGGSLLPALVYRRVGGNPSRYRSHSGGGGRDTARIQFDCYAPTGDQAATLAREVVKAWNGYKGGAVGSAFAESQLSMPELEVGRYREIVDVMIDYEVDHD